MQAIILAAGVGERLGAATAGKPKSLLEIGETSLLLRHCRALRALGIDMIHVVTGFGADLIDAELNTLPDSAGIRRMVNAEFRLGSVISLWTAREVLRSGSPVILMDADVLCDTRILGKLAASSVANCFLLDRNLEPGDEPVKLCIRNGQIVEFRKQIAAGLQCDLQGESVRFFRFAPVMAAALAARCEEYVSQGLVREPYEEAIRDLVLGAPAEFGYEDVTGLPWIEIDFPGDVARARDEILPRITS
jgi:choline kinase